MMYNETESVAIRQEKSQYTIANITVIPLNDLVTT